MTLPPNRSPRDFPSTCSCRPAENRSDVFDYIEIFYNPKRRHGSNNQLSPVQFEQQYLLSNATVQETRGDSPGCPTSACTRPPAAGFARFCRWISWDVRRHTHHSLRSEVLMKIEGACHCGQISFTAEIDPSRVMICHCTDCQVLSGSPFRVVVVAPFETFELHGQPSSYVKLAQSGDRRAQMFCPTCGTPLFACAPENPASVSIRLGCVRQRSELVPATQIWQQSALPWLPDLQTIPGSAQQQSLLPPPGRSGL